MTYEDRLHLEILKRGDRRVFVVPLKGGGYRWFVQGQKGHRGTAASRDGLLQAISGIR